MSEVSDEWDRLQAASGANPHSATYPYDPAWVDLGTFAAAVGQPPKALAGYRLHLCPPPYPSAYRLYGVWTALTAQWQLPQQTELSELVKIGGKRRLIRSALTQYQRPVLPDVP